MHLRLAHGFPCAAQARQFRKAQLGASARTQLGRKWRHLVPINCKRFGNIRARQIACPSSTATISVLNHGARLGRKKRICGDCCSKTLPSAAALGNPCARPTNSNAKRENAQQDGTLLALVRATLSGIRAVLVRLPGLSIFTNYESTGRGGQFSVCLRACVTCIFRPQNAFFNQETLLYGKYNSRDESW